MHKNCCRVFYTIIESQALKYDSTPALTFKDWVFDHFNYLINDETLRELIAVFIQN